MLALESLGLPKDATTTVVPALRETAGNVEVIRRTFRRSFKSLMNHPVSSNVPPQFRDRILKLRRFPYNLMGFADSVVISVPLDFREPTSAMMAATGLFATLKCVAIVMLTSMGNGVPLRAGIDVGLGVRGLFSREVYGPVAVNAYTLESQIAKYPRAAIGDGVIAYLRTLEQFSNKKPHQPENAYIADMTAECRKLICDAPDDGVHMLHILQSNLGGPLVKAFGWARDQRDKFRTLNDEKLTEYYERLVGCFHVNGYVS